MRNSEKSNGVKTNTWISWMLCFVMLLVVACTSHAGQVTILPSPSGRIIIVDGLSYPAPQTFTWADGASRRIGRFCHSKLIEL
jgi:hypothetical protein